MRNRYTFKIASTALLAHKSRSLLTILGIVIGISAIVMVLALGDGVQGLIVGELGGLGAETVVIRPGQEPDGPTDFADGFFVDSLKDREFDAITRTANVPDLEAATPEVFVSASVSHGGETYHRSTIIGISAEYMIETLDLKLSEGEIFDASDIRSKTSVAILGTKVKEELFGDDDVIGKTVLIKDRKFKVIGVFAPRGQVVFFNVDNLVIIPYSTANTYLTGKSHYTQFLARANSPEDVAQMKEDITLTLRELHNITDPDKDDFYVQTQQGLVEQVRSILGAFVAFLSLVVAVALVVGGVGVMNVMLVSVTERTKEIGLRKSLGATNRNILVQFLTESIILTLLGGVIGIILGALFAYGATVAIKIVAGYDLGFHFPYMGALIGALVSVVTGLVFGIYPAREASRKSPIEAMRFE